MNSHLDRILKLAQKTGDRVIIYDKYEGNHFVLMDIDEYEYFSEDSFDAKSNVVGLSETQLIDKINRDIAIWRANRELEESIESGNSLEDELEDDEFDPFAEDYVSNDEWHSVAKVLEDKEEKREEKLYNEVKEEKIEVPKLEIIEQAESEAEPLDDDEPIFFEEPIE